MNGQTTLLTENAKWVHPLTSTTLPDIHAKYLHVYRVRERVVPDI
jgi:hypothetical protein